MYPRHILAIAAILCVPAAIFLASTGRMGNLLARLPLFAVSQVEVEGLVLLTPEEVVHRASIPPGASIWEPLEVWASRFSSQGDLASVQVRRVLPAGLVVTIAEREPVALVATPELRLVTEDGIMLEARPSGRTVSLPVALVSVDSTGAVSDSTSLALLGLLGRIRRVDAVAFDRISEARPWGGLGEIEILAAGVEARVLLQAVTEANMFQMRRVLDELARLQREQEPVVPYLVDFRYQGLAVVRPT
jgi:hypothetical protein